MLFGKVIPWANMKSSVIILGAGASADYGYPLWNDLKTQLIDFDLDGFFNEIVDFPETEKQSFQDVHGEFKTLAANHPILTLDSIIAEIDRPKSKHQNPTGFKLLSMVGFLIAKIECSKRVESKANWVYRFQDYIINQILDQLDYDDSTKNYLSALTFVSLNYDRNFEYYFCDQFFSRLLDKDGYKPSGLHYSLNLSGHTKAQILKPHGTIAHINFFGQHFGHGMIKSLQYGVVPAPTSRQLGTPSFNFGDENILKWNSVQAFGTIAVVEEVGNNSFAEANYRIEHADNIVCLGLSVAGITQSKIALPAGKRVHLSNAKSDAGELQLRYNGVTFESLSENERRAESSTWPEKLKALLLC
jgi:hypothetical protein